MGEPRHTRDRRRRAPCGAASPQYNTLVTTTTLRSVCVETTRIRVCGEHAPASSLVRRLCRACSTKTIPDRLCDYPPSGSTVTGSGDNLTRISILVSTVIGTMRGIILYLCVLSLPSLVCGFVPRLARSDLSSTLALQAKEEGGDVLLEKNRRDLWKEIRATTERVPGLKRAPLYESVILQQRIHLSTKSAPRLGTDQSSRSI